MEKNGTYKDKRRKEEDIEKNPGIPTERRVKAAAAVLVLLILIVAGYGLKTSGKLKVPKLGKTDPLGIERIYVGATEGTITQEDGTWYIDLTVDEDFSFQCAAINLELPEGASVSGDTNCLLTELGGQYMVNLGVQDAALTITDGEESRDYYFRIELK